MNGAPSQPRLTRIYGAGLRYYARSIPLLASGVRPRRALLELALRRGLQSIQFRDGSRLLVRSPLDAWIAKEAILDDVYGCHQLEAGWNVIDVGAAIGEFTVPAARRVCRGVVHAYEPASRTAALLRRNLELNGLSNVSVFEEAVAANRGVVAFDDDLRAPAMYHLAGNGSARPASATKVSSLDLEEVLGRLPQGRCDFLKMDCEGAEFEILLAAEASVLRRIARVALEYHDFTDGSQHGELVRLFESLGSSVRVVPSPVYKETGYLYAELRALT